MIVGRPVNDPLSDHAVRRRLAVFAEPPLSLHDPNKPTGQAGGTVHKYPHMPLRARSTPGMKGYGYVMVGLAFVDPRVDGVRRTPAVCRRRLTLLRLTPWVVAREAAVAPPR